MINPISLETKILLEKKSTKALPDQPSKMGYSPDQIKRKMYEAVLGDTLSLFTEVNRIVAEANELIGDAVGGDATSVSYTPPDSEIYQTWIDLSNMDQYVGADGYVALETANTDNLFEINSPYDDQGNFRL